jgi:NADH:ubiquinone reductase (non-electrogenic)
LTFSSQLSSSQHKSRLHRLQKPSMATIAALRPLGLASRGIAPLSRAFSTSSRRTLIARPRALVRPAFNKIQLRQSFRRHQSSEGGKTVKPQRGAIRTVLLWTWRFTYMSAIGGLAYVGYGVWQLRHPVEQLPPDPNKKTLVILGTFDCNWLLISEGRCVLT